MNTQVTMAGLNIPSMSTLGIDVASDMEDTIFDGIIGMAPRSQDGLSDLLVDKLHQAGVISTPVFSTNYKLSSEQSTIDFGGWDTSIVTDETLITWIDLYDTQYWSLPVSNVGFGDETYTMNQFIRRAIIDTGTSLTYIDSTSFD